MKKKIIVFIMLCSVVAAGLKGATKTRVYELEKQVVDLSKSERKAWDTIEKLNKQLAELERQAAMRYYQSHKQFADADDDDEDEEEFGPFKR